MGRLWKNILELFMKKFKIISSGHGQSTRVEFDGKPIDGVQAIQIHPILPNKPVCAVIHVAFVDLEIECEGEMEQKSLTEDAEVVDTE